MSRKAHRRPALSLAGLRSRIRSEASRIEAFDQAGRTLEADARTSVLHRLFRAVERELLNEACRDAAA